MHGITFCHMHLNLLLMLQPIYKSTLHATDFYYHNAHKEHIMSLGGDNIEQMEIL